MFTALGRCAYRNFQRDRQLIYTDKSLSAFSDSSCQHACDVEREFVCRSYTFLSTVSNHACVATEVETLRSSHMDWGLQMLAQFTTRTKSPDHYTLLHSFKYNQQDATLYNILYYCQCCACFRRFLRPSSGTQKLYIQHLVYAKLACCYC